MNKKGRESESGTDLLRETNKQNGFLPGVKRKMREEMTKMRRSRKKNKKKKTQSKTK